MASKPEQGDMHEQLDEVYRSESRRILATLIRLLGDFDLAEEALHDAFRAALEQWPRDGVPTNPRAWLVSAGRFRAIDTLRRRARFDASLAAIAAQIEANARDATEWEGDDIPDDRLRLIFTCCHPVLPSEARMALTLREVCGLTTEEIARAFLTAVLATYLIQAENTKPDETRSQHRVRPLRRCTDVVRASPFWREPRLMRKLARGFAQRTGNGAPRLRLATAGAARATSRCVLAAPLLPLETIRHSDDG